MQIPTPRELGLPYESWRPGQRTAIRTILHAKTPHVVINAPTGSGKSVIAATLPLLDPNRRHVTLTATKSLMDQYGIFALTDLRGASNYTCRAAMDEFAEWFPVRRRSTVKCDDGPCHVGIPCTLMQDGCDYYDARRAFVSSKAGITNYAAWLANRKMGQGLGVADRLICDECLVAGSLVGNHPIETIRVGDLVPSFNGALCHRMVTQVFKRRPTLLQSTWIGSRRILSTLTHRFYTRSGWRRAGDLIIGDEVLCLPYVDKSSKRHRDQSKRPTRDVPAGSSSQLRQLWLSGRTGRQYALLRVEEDEARVLLKCLSNQSANVGASADVGPRKSAPSTSNEDAQSNEVVDRSRQNAYDTSSYGLEADPSWRQRSAFASQSTTLGVLVRVGDRSSGDVGTEAQRLSDLLQDRCSEQDVESGNRSGWSQPSDESTTTAGSEEGTGFVWSRVEAATVLEPGSDGTFGGVCSDGFVYDLEVAGTHNYIADGAVVHNSHALPEQLMGACRIDIPYHLIDSTKVPRGHKEWARWATARLEMLAHTKDDDARVKRERIERGLRMMASMDETWAWDTDEDGYHFEPTIPRLLLPLLQTLPEKDLDSRSSIVYLSATVTPSMLALLAVPPADVTYLALQNHFPVERRPIYVLPGARVDYRSMKDPAVVERWAGAIARFCEARSDRRGLLHTVSFSRARLLYDLAPRELQRRMVLHTPRMRGVDALAQFAQAGPDAVLVSPSMMTGVNFAHRAAEFQVITKLPFPDTRSNIMKARIRSTERYRDHFTMTNLVQACGRIVRAEDDQGESAIIDEHFSWWYRNNRDLAPDWFDEAVVRTRRAIVPFNKLG